MIDIAFERLNEQEVVITESKQDLTQEKLEPIVYLLPKSLEEWVKFKFPEALTSKANSMMDDFNLMTKFIFDKAESTFLYGNLAVDMLCSAGQHV